MIVYQALSSYQILECIEHRKVFHAEENAVLILGTYIVEKYPNYRALEDFGLFNKVYLFEFGMMPNKEELILTTIQNRIRDTFQFDIQDIDKIYIAGIHTYLSMYLVANNINFSMFEDGSGALSRPWVLAEITKKSSPQKYEIISKFGLYDHSAECIIEKWCNLDVQITGFKDNKAKHFDVVQSFDKLTEDTQKKVLSFFGIEKKIEIEKNSILVMTQQFSNLEQLSFEEHILIYQHLFDFYLDGEDNVILKLHPDDIMYYEKLFTNITVIKKMFPAELLPFVFSNIPKKAITISSTSTNLIKQRFYECIEFNELYERSFKYDYIYYAVARLLQKMCVGRVDGYGINHVQLYNMLNALSYKNIKINYGIENNHFAEVLLIDDFETAIDEMDVEQLKRNYDVVIYLNSLKQYLMIGDKNSYSINYMYPLNINIEKSVDDIENCVLNNMEYIVWVDTENERWIDMLNEYEEEKKLTNAHGVLKVRGVNENEIELMRTKGLLEATERRLLDYIKREKELKDEIDILKKGGK